MPAEGTEVITQEVRIEARPETVFAFLTDSDKMTKWKGRSARLDPRPGGSARSGSPLAGRGRGLSGRALGGGAPSSRALERHISR